MRKSITLFSFIVLLLSIARVVGATDVVSQLDHSSNQVFSNDASHTYVQSLGVLDSTISQISVYYKQNNGGDRQLNVRLCDNSDYSSTLVCDNPVNYSSLNYLVKDNVKNLNVMNFTPFETGSKYVYIHIGSAGGTSTVTLYGSSGSTIDGEFWIMNSGTEYLADLYVLVQDGETCFDNILNQNETSLDWGGVCDTLSYFSDLNPAHQVSVTADIVSASSDITVSSSSGILTGMIVSAFGIPFNTYVGSVNGNVVSLVDVDSDPVVATETGVVGVDFVDVVDPAVGLFDVTVNIDDSEFESGMTVCMYFENDGVTLSGEFFLERWVSVAGDQCFDLTNSGANEISSSGIDFEDFKGLSTVTYEVFKPTWISSVPVLGWIFDDKSFLRTEVRFALTELSQLDIARVEDNLGATLLANVGLGEISACKIATFSLGRCLQGLFIPEKDQLMNSWCSFQVGREYVAGSGCTGNDTLFGGVLNVWPLGYLTRFLDIIVYADPVMPPALSYTFGTAVNGTGLTGESIEYQIYDHFDVLESIESDQGTNSNIWDIVMPYFTVVINLALFVAIFVKLIATDWSFTNSSVSSPRSSGGTRKPDSRAVRDVKSRYPQLKNYE